MPNRKRGGESSGSDPDHEVLNALASSSSDEADSQPSKGGELIPSVAATRVSLGTRVSGQEMAIFLGGMAMLGAFVGSSMATALVLWLSRRRDDR